MEKPCVRPSKQHRTQERHPGTAGLLPAALGLQLLHTYPPDIPAMKLWIVSTEHPPKDQLYTLKTHSHTLYDLYVTYTLQREYTIADLHCYHQLNNQFEIMTIHIMDAACCYSLQQSSMQSSTENCCKLYCPCRLNILCQITVQYAKQP